MNYQYIYDINIFNNIFMTNDRNSLATKKQPLISPFKIGYVRWFGLLNIVVIQTQQSSLCLHIFPFHYLPNTQEFNSDT